MQTLRTLIVALVAGVALMGAALGPASAQQERPFFYNITTDDSWAAGMALAQANVAAGRGHDVTVFLNVRGVHLADRHAKTGTFPPAGKTPRQLLEALIGSGEKVLVCGACMQVAGMGDDDLIDGALKASPKTTFGALEAPGAVVLSY
mgnify:CR=1 FL=1